MPGRLLIDNADLYLASSRRVADFVRQRPVRYVLGGHIELDSSGQTLPWQSQYHPNERTLPLSKDDVLALPAAIEQFNGFYSSSGHFIMMNSMRILKLSAVLAVAITIAIIVAVVVFVRRWRRRRRAARINAGRLMLTAITVRAPHGVISAALTPATRQRSRRSSSPRQSCLSCSAATPRGAPGRRSQCNQQPRPPANRAGRHRRQPCECTRAY